MHNLQISNLNLALILTLTLILAKSRSSVCSLRRLAYCVQH